MMHAIVSIYDGRRPDNKDGPAAPRVGWDRDAGAVPGSLRMSETCDAGAMRGQGGMCMADVVIGPVDRAARFESLDVLRGVAALGILLMNIPVMGMSWHWPKPPLPARPDIDWIAYSIQQVTFDGTMRGLFTLLFGAGMVVMLDRRDPAREAEAVQAFFVRCFALMLLGIVNFALFLWPGEILFNYGVAGLAVFLFRKAEKRLLIVAAATALIVMTLGLAASKHDQFDRMALADAAVAARSTGRQPTSEQAESLKKRDAAMQQLMSPAARAKERATRTSWPAVTGWSADTWMEYNLSWDGAAFLLESIGFMLAGIFLFRTGVLTGKKTIGFYTMMAVCGLAAGGVIRGWLLSLAWQSGFVFSMHWMGPMTYLYEAGRLAMTIGMLGLVMTLLKAGLMGRLAGVLAAVGRTALTTYIGQSVITSILFYAFGLWGRFGFAQLMGVAALIWIAQCVFSVLWLRWFEMGPAEWLLRTLTYGAARPIRRPVLARPRRMTIAA